MYEHVIHRHDEDGIEHVPRNGTRHWKKFDLTSNSGVIKKIHIQEFIPWI
jgi:hypothetical protein